MAPNQPTTNSTPTVAAMMVARNRMEAAMVTCQRQTLICGESGVT